MSTSVNSRATSFYMHENFQERGKVFENIKAQIDEVFLRNLKKSSKLCWKLKSN